MRRLFFTVIAMSLPVAAQAQSRGTRVADTGLRSDRIPAEMRREVAARWDEPSAIRAYGRVTIDRDSVVSENLGVQDGPLTIAGRVTANVTAINSDVILLPGARIDGDLWVIGGRLEGRDSATVRGEIRVYSGAINVGRTDGRTVIDDETPRRWRRRYTRMGDESWSDPI